jgi:hypothetical protein
MTSTQPRRLGFGAPAQVHYRKSQTEVWLLSALDRQLRTDNELHMRLVCKQQRRMSE